MWPRSSIPRVTTMFLKMSRRSSRSRPASLISLSELTGSASRAIAMRPVPLGLGPHRTLPERRYAHSDGEGGRLAPRGAAQDAGRLGGLLPRLRARDSLLRRDGGRAPV